MARANSTNRRQTTYRDTGRRGSAYVGGSTVRKLDIPASIEEAPRKKLSHTTRKNREKAHYMNFAYVMFLTSALVAAGFILIGYIQLQSDITNSVKNIARLESQLNNLRADNDEQLSRIESSIDLEEVKRIAINELGMRYADEGQIILYSGEGSDYVRQVAELPTK
ncbi:MAG: cell division protein FtsL [Lachnospiraceae bacterium]|nr:cell division protein FtsL [Lachnospiraceae bacterium]